MRIIQLYTRILCISFATTTFFGCTDQYITLPPPVPDQSFIEEFDTIVSAHAKGWKFENRSEPLGPGDWVQAYSNFNLPYTLINAKGPASTNGQYRGNFLPAFSSSAIKTGYITTSCYASAGTIPEGRGTISNWVISPVLVMQNGDKIIFYTSAMDSVYTYNEQSAIAGEPPNIIEKINLINRLQVRINMHDTTINCGKGINPGLFDVVLLDINESYTKNGFPYYNEHGWTRMEATVQGLLKPVSGRFAFRSFLEGGGPGDNERGGVVNLDRVQYISRK